MRVLIVTAALAAAAPAWAQSPTPYTDQLRLGEIQAQQDLARNRAIAQENELMALDARLRTEQALRDIQVQRSLPPLPTLPDDPKRPPPVLDTSGVATIPDDRLEASNQRVREASETRR